MIFKCANCGGNVVYNPEKQVMFCPYCESEESQKEIDQENSTCCVNCGAEIEVNEYTSATKCDHCDTYVIMDNRISEQYKPELVLPFKISKDKARDLLKNRFKNAIIAPSDFLATKTLENFKGVYVPYWLYDFNTKVDYRGIGVKVKHWTSGGYEYTETSKYMVHRNFDINYEKIPVDASNEMDDITMNEVEPFEYIDLIDFEPKFLSGFYSEIYNKSAEELQILGQKKANIYTNQWLASTTNEYTRVENEQKEIENIESKNSFALLPVWVYTYRYAGKNYTYYVNGQTGESIGKTPISASRAILCTFLVFALVFLALFSIVNFLEVL